jgi:DNA invertase Pin-like site-specific DNA recombinase
MIDRTEFNRMLSKAKQGAFDVIVVEAIDRFTRDFDDGMVEIIGLKRSGVKIADIHTGIKDLESLAGKMGIFVDLIGSEDFRKRAGEKTKRGQLAQLQSGYRPGETQGRGDDNLRA